MKSIHSLSDTMLKRSINAISDTMLNEQIKKCHRILKDGADDEATFKMAEKLLPMLAQERNRRENIYVKRRMQNLIDSSK